ncbi:MAG: T9SS type A sorting domain-containing protein, partial [Bacteroidota bacterium]
AYVAFMDGLGGGKATVMKYDSIYFGINDLHHPGFHFYPNPAKDKITIETTGFSNLAVLSADGRELIRQKITPPRTSVQTDYLPLGIYFIRMTGDNTVMMEKFIKN